MPLRPPAMVNGPPPDGRWLSSVCAAMSLSTGTSSSLRHSLFSRARCFSSIVVVSAAASRGIIRMPGPLSIDALLKYELAEGIA